MKRFLLFAGQELYPVGGWGDFQGSFDTISAAEEAYGEMDETDADWFHVVDSSTGQIVKKGK